MSIDLKDAMMIEEKKVMKEKSKIGHRRINDQGTVTYKKKTTSEIQKAIQLGIRISVTLAHKQKKRDMLLKDFGVVETLSFPRNGGKDTPTHDLSDFTFKTFAPIAFRYFRDFFQVDIADYLNSICDQELRELSNAGASGSIFYITYDDEFIIKTVQHKEASFLQKLLPEYYINLIQHPRTLLPKFYGLYCYQTMGKNIRFVIMNNLVPSIKIHEKYDLKGSTYKRIASATEKGKSSPTLKDLDFRENHNDGLYLEVDTFEALLNTIQRDCRVLESFSIMDYSLLLGIHNVDESLRARKVKAASAPVDKKNYSPPSDKNHTIKEIPSGDSDEAAIGQQNVDLISNNSKPCLQTEAKGNQPTVLPKESHVANVLECKDSENSDHSQSTSADAYYTPGKAVIAAKSGDQGNQNNNNDIKATTDAPASSSPSEPLPASPKHNNSSEKSQSSSVTKHPFNRQKSRSRSTRRIAAYSTVLESIHAPVEQVELEDAEEDYIPTGGIPARNKIGDRLILFMGIIDILQSYRILKKMEHNMKAIFLDASTISVTNPTFYAQRFQDFFGIVVFKKIPSLDQPQILGSHAIRFRNFVHLAMRHHPDRKRSSSIRKDLHEKEKQPNARDSVYDKSNVVPQAAELSPLKGDCDQTGTLDLETKPVEGVIKEAMEVPVKVDV